VTDFITLLRREMARFLKLPNQTIIPPILTAILYILIFGYSVGFRIESIRGYSYVVYIIPGLVMMGVMTSAYSNSTTSLFIARYENFIQDLLVSPLSYIKMVSAYILSSAARGLIVGTLTLLVSLFLTTLPLTAPLVMLFFMVMAAATFGAYGILVGLWAERWDHIAVFQNYLITPLIFLGGVFYNIRQLPSPWQQISFLNPLFYMVDGFRYGLLGVSAVSPWISGAVLMALLVTGTAISMYLFRIGWKLRD
jgi:ABC-2 type transport system permease protein